MRFVFESTTQFGDGRTVFTDHSDFTLTNVETGSAYVEHTNATFTDTFTTDGNILEVLDGRYFFLFLPGDLGPGGVVGDGGALFILVGHVEYAYDPDTNLNITFQADGCATDVCQLLSP